jgi:hypothetical protein
VSDGTDATYALSDVLGVSRITANEKVLKASKELAACADIHDLLYAVDCI